MDIGALHKGKGYKGGPESRGLIPFIGGLLKGHGKGRATTEGKGYGNKGKARPLAGPKARPAKDKEKVAKELAKESIRAQVRSLAGPKALDTAARTAGAATRIQRKGKHESKSKLAVSISNRYRNGLHGGSH